MPNNSPYGDQTAGTNPGPYGNQTAGHAVGPYAPGRATRPAAHKPTPVPKPLAKAIARTFTKAGHVFSTGTHKATPRRQTHVPDVTPTKPADPGNHKPAIHLPPIPKLKSGGGGGGSAGIGGYGKQLSRALGQAMASLIDPAKYANASANAQYGGIVHDLSTQIAHAPADEAQHHADISSWYGKVAKQAAGSSGRIADIASGAAGGADASTLALVNALGGGPAAASVAAFGNIQSGGIRGEGQIGSNFENQLATAIAGEGAEQQRNESTRSNNALTALRSQLSQARLKKGDAFTQALGQGQGQRLTQLAQIQNMMLGQQLAGPQLQQAQLANQLAQQNLQTGQIDQATRLAQLQDFQTKANNPAGTFGTLQAPDRAKLSDLITGMFVGKGGRLRQAPKSVGPQVRNYLYNTVGYEKSPETEAFANSIATAILQGGSGVKRLGKGLTRAQEYRAGHRK